MMRFIDFLTLLEALDPEVRHNRKMLVKHFLNLSRYSDWNAEHSLNVTKMAREFGKYLGMDSNKIVQTSFAHDVGKITIPKKILHKPAELTDDERTEMNKHAMASSKLLKVLTGDMGYIAKLGAKHHHTSAEELNKLVETGVITRDDCQILKLLMIVDIFDGCTDPNRPYHKPPNRPKTIDEAFEILLTKAPTDREMAKKFVKWHQENYAGRSRN